jgi:RimJ/RimL family protein N-acetyltransferase
MQVMIREVEEADLEIFFRQQLDPESHRLIGTAMRDRDDFMAHWEKHRRDPSVRLMAILANGAVAGHVVSYVVEQKRQVGYWLGGEFAGQGIATRALKLFLEAYLERPMYAHVAEQNPPSARVLEKCGFDKIGESQRPRPVTREVVAEAVYRLND